MGFVWSFLRDFPRRLSSTGLRATPALIMTLSLQSVLKICVDQETPRGVSHLEVKLTVLASLSKRRYALSVDHRRRNRVDDLCPFMEHA